MQRRQPARIHDARRDRQEVIMPLALRDDNLARYVNLKDYMSEVEYQGDMNTCAANAVAGILEYFARRYQGRKFEASRLFMYYNGRRMADHPSRFQDYGVLGRDVILGIREFGVCDERTWPYKRRYINTEPSKKAFDEAIQWSVFPLRIPPDIRSIETCLHNQIPVLVDIVLLEEAGPQIRANNGVLPVPDLNANRINPLNIHTVLLVGYCRDRQWFIVRNSWGKDWGCDGYFYMLYQYLRHPLFNQQDGLWSMTHVVPRRPGRLPIRNLVRPNQAHKHR